MGKKMVFNYHDPQSLLKYLDKSGRIKPRAKTHLTKPEQREMKKAVDRARQLALLPFPPRKRDREQAKGNT